MIRGRTRENDILWPFHSRLIEVNDAMTGSSSLTWGFDAAVPFMQRGMWLNLGVVPIHRDAPDREAWVVCLLSNVGRHAASL